MNSHIQAMNVDNHFSAAGEEVPADRDKAVDDFPIGYEGEVGGVEVTMHHNYSVYSASDHVAFQNGEANLNQLTLSFRGQVFVFDGVTTHKVQSVFQLLGGFEYSPGMQAVGLSSPNQEDSVDYPLHCADPKRLESLIRFREKRKRRCYGKKIRYDVRQEVAFRMQRKNGQFARKGSGEPKPDDNPPEETWCVHCGTSSKDTPMMRRGPAGPRTLCNACGLTWANKGIMRNLYTASYDNTLLTELEDEDHRNHDYGAPPCSLSYQVSSSASDSSVLAARQRL
ncbi:GATA transcription factor 25-like isoform X1 [Nicotiana tabacum]|uniref:GATA transcription factor 25-like n=1 Tax=Nicotiana tabacum TaxID=4097 RepID=A0A1S3Z623_TOBAC|nr:GATA transcription factor 25-like isoform X1 [Nicotiana tomentosiformis]XP_016459799.1 PREDICTED: GATA transcription factor 25-like [Nicotiana tabacum]XP_033514587.1 GATA transcription factor 25-like isoform X1 [Nicotiana tomentosiformis]